MAAQHARTIAGFATALIVAACSAVASAAYGQDIPCDSIDRMAFDAANNFVGLKGRVLDDDPDQPSFATNVNLPGAARCTLTYIDGDGGIECLWHYRDAQAAIDGSRKIDQWIASCAGANDLRGARRSYRGETRVWFSRYLNQRGDYQLTIHPEGR
jgi:hypothetical protein